MAPGSRMHVALALSLCDDCCLDNGQLWAQRHAVGLFVYLKTGTRVLTAAFQPGPAGPVLNWPLPHEGNPQGYPPEKEPAMGWETQDGQEPDPRLLRMPSLTPHAPNQARRGLLGRE